MAKEILDVVDTAVKIGLGALISGVSAYYAATLNQRNDAKKRIQDRKLNTIEAVAAHVDEFVKGLLSLVAAVDGVQRRYPERNKLNPNDKIDSQLWDFIRESDKKFCDIRDHGMFATSKLYLIGLPDEADLLEALTKLGNEVRITVMFDYTIPNQEKLDMWRREAKRIQNEFLSEVSKHYKSVD